MEAVIFLDVDGVLNCSTTKEKCAGFVGIEDEKVGFLKEIVNLMGGEIVLNSSWREDYPNGKMGKYLHKKLKKQGLDVYDSTISLFWRDRAEEVNTWLKMHPKTKYAVILDDEDFDWESMGLENNWVRTIDGEWNINTFSPGLSQKHVDFIRENKEQFRVRNFGQLAE